MNARTSGKINNQAKNTHTDNTREREIIFSTMNLILFVVVAGHNSIPSMAFNICNVSALYIVHIFISLVSKMFNHQPKINGQVCERA